MESLPRLLREWLVRSGALPLTIYFFHKDWNTAMSDSDLPRDIRTQKNALKIATGLAIDVLNLHSGRWRNLHFTASADILKRFSSSTKPKQLVSLELAAPLAMTLLPTPEFMMESELNLTHLKLICFPLTSINVRWDNIRYATLSGVTIHEALDFLRRAPSLEHYCVSTSERRNIGFINPILHPRLRSLRLSTPYLGSILKEINLPSLEELTQKTSGRDRPMAAMLSFVQRSGCCIKVLNLNGPLFLSEHLDTLLQKVPSLECIRLCFWLVYGDEEAVMDDILIRIFYSNPEDRTAEPFLSHLQFIECKMASPVPPFSWASIPKFYRDNGHRRSLALRAFAHKSDITDQTAVQLLELADEGVDLQIVDEVRGGDFLENFRTLHA